MRYVNNSKNRPMRRRIRESENIGIQDYSLVVCHDLNEVSDYDMDYETKEHFKSLDTFERDLTQGDGMYLVETSFLNQLKRTNEYFDCDVLCFDLPMDTYIANYIDLRSGSPKMYHEFCMMILLFEPRYQIVRDYIKALQYL